MGLTTIAVGIDRSELAADALRWAISFARPSAAEVHAVSSWQMPLVGLLPGSIEGLPTVETMSQQCAEGLEDVVENVAPNADVKRVVVEGKPGPAVVDASSNADLLVLGRTGQGKRHGVARVAEIILGSTARHCIHHARVPVVAIPSGAAWPSPASVVVGVDGSSCSLLALDWALANLPADSTLHVVRAFAPWVGDGLTPAEMITDDGLHKALRRETQELVDAALLRSPNGSVGRLTVQIIISNARDALADPGYPVDLIIVGERGHTGVASMVLGSVSDHLVRYANCPVLVVPDATR